MGKFFRFERMVTPFIIQIIFWLGTIASLVAGVLMMLGEGGGMSIFLGLLLILFGPIAVRIYCEILMIAFRMLSLLIEVRDHLP